MSAESEVSRQVIVYGVQNGLLMLRKIGAARCRHRLALFTPTRPYKTSNSSTLIPACRKILPSVPIVISR